jgi:hypothetical protein
VTLFISEWIVSCYKKKLRNALTDDEHANLHYCISFAYQLSVIETRQMLKVCIIRALGQRYRLFFFAKHDFDDRMKFSYTV